MDTSNEPEVYRTFELVPNPRKALREQIAADTEAFLKAGGQITTCRPSGPKFAGDDKVKYTYVSLDEFGDDK